MGLEERLRDSGEVVRLHNILKRFGVREKLGAIKEKFWKEGSILRSEAYVGWVDGISAELRLVTVYPSSKDVPGFRLVDDIFYPQGRSVYSPTSKGTIETVILSIGAASVNSTKYKASVSELGDHMYVGFRTVDSDAYSEQYKLSSFFPGGWCRNMKMKMGARDLEVSQFIDKSLAEFTGNEFLPSNLKKGRR